MFDRFNSKPKINNGWIVNRWIVDNNESKTNSLTKTTGSKKQNNWKNIGAWEKQNQYQLMLLIALIRRPKSLLKTRVIFWINPRIYPIFYIFIRLEVVVSHWWEVIIRGGNVRRIRRVGSEFPFQRFRSIALSYCKITLSHLSLYCGSAQSH